MTATYTVNVTTLWTTVVQASTIITGPRFVNIANVGSTVVLNDGTTITTGNNVDLLIDNDTTVTGRTSSGTATLTVEDQGTEAPFPLTGHGIYYASDYGTAGTGAAIQAALDAAATAGGGRVIVDIANTATWTISATLTIGSNTWLDVDPAATIFLANNSSVQMVTNADLVNGNTNVKVTGGLWDGNEDNQTNSGTTRNLIIMDFRHVNGLRVTNCRFKNVQKRCVCPAACTNIIINDIEAITNVAVIVQINGPGSKIDIRNIRGTTVDDMVALTSSDYAWAEITAGDITDVTIDGVYPSAASAAIKVVAGNNGGFGATKIRRVTIANIYGTTTTSAIKLIEDTAGQSDWGQITIQNVDVTVTANNQLVLLSSTGARDVAMRNLHMDGTGFSTCYLVAAILSDAINPTAIESILIEDAFIHGTPTTCAIIKIDSKVTVDRLVVRGAYITENAANTCRVVQINSADSYVKTVTVDGFEVTNSAGCVVHVVAAGGKFDRATVTNGYLTSSVVGGAGAVVTKATASACVINLSDLHLNCSSIADIACPAQIQVSTSNVTVSGAGIKALGVNATPITIRGHGLYINTNKQGVTRDGTQVINVQHPQIRADVSILAKADGDEVYNTNAALGTSTGRVISNGSAWKNIYSGLTEP